VEVWKPINGFKRFYEVSTHGQVRRIKSASGTNKGRLHKPVIRNGYQQVLLSCDNRLTLCWIHRLVATTFLEQPSDRYEVNHKDGNPLNNSLENLEWVTRSENMSHAYRIGLRKPAPQKGEKNGSSKLTEDAVIQIREFAGKLTFSEMAKQFGVNRQTIYRVIHRKSWRHI